jgi:hypothetical protein
VQVQPGLVWSLLDEVEVVAGALWSFGSRPASTPPTIGDPLGLAGLRSEFGSFPHVWYAEVKAYF